MAKSLHKITFVYVRPTRLKATRWNTKKTVSATRKAQWNVLPLVRRSTQWQDRQILTVALSSPFKNCKRVQTFQRGTVWHDKASLNVKREVLFDSQSTVCKQAEVVFNVTQRVAWKRKLFFKQFLRKKATSRVHFQSLNPVSALVKSTWKVEVIPTVRSSSWNIAESLFKKTKSQWKSDLAIRLKVEAIWNTHHLGVRASTSWGVIAVVAVNASTISHSLLTVSKQIDTIWNERKCLYARRIVRWRRKLTGKVVVGQRYVARPNEFRDGYLPATTVKQMGSKQKHKLGIK